MCDKPFVMNHGSYRALLRCDQLTTSYCTYTLFLQASRVGKNPKLPFKGMMKEETFRVDHLSEISCQQEHPIK
jgi:hypothetical protein